MHSTTVFAFALLTSIATSTPVPQAFDWTAIEDPTLTSIQEPDIPIVSAEAAATTISFNPALAAASVSAGVAANPSDTSLRKRQDDLHLPGPEDGSYDDNADCGTYTPYDEEPIVDWYSQWSSFGARCRDASGV